MPRPDDDARDLVDLIRAIVDETLSEAPRDTRTTGVLSGVVEDVDEDLDVVYVRMDSETIGSDPTQTDNYESPGVIPASRLGETFRGEQARVDFLGPAGGQAMRTGIQSRIVLPYGAESGRRIILDGNEGFIVFFNEDGEQVAVIDSERWAAGDLETPGERLTIDPIGGLRFRDDMDDLVTILDKNGYTLRNAVTGQVSAEIRANGSVRVVDPNGTDDIEIVTSSLGTLPNPNYTVTKETSPGATIEVPFAEPFTLPQDDISVGHGVLWHGASTITATMTSPGGYTERSDRNHTSNGTSLHSSTATDQNTFGAGGVNFTSTDSTWQQAVGQNVIIRGGGAATPSFRSVTNNNDVSDASSITVSMATPAGVVAGDVLVAFVSVGTIGGFVPTGWVTPEGWIFLGADFSSSGAGEAQSTIAAGTWVKLATASEPATHATSIQLPTGHKQIQATMIAVQGAFLHPGGAQIRVAGRPTRRLLAFNELMSSATSLCNFTDIPQGWDNLELVWDGSVAADAATRVCRMRFNGDGGANYLYKNQGDGAAGGGATTMIMGSLGSNATDKSVGSVNIYGYTSEPKPVLLHRNTWADGLGVNSQHGTAHWAGPGPITRVQLFVNSGGAQWAAGSRVYLYGY